jgi:ubiquitin carboxyl-terminal hydrolase 10
MDAFLVVTNLQTFQSDSVLTIQDAFMGVCQSQSMQDCPSGLGDASQQMLIDVLPPILVLHLKRFEYDAAAGGVIKISKPVQFSSELEIPFGTCLIFLSCNARD